MEFRPIAIEDRALFEKYLAGRYYRLGTYDFSNLYMWRNWDPYLVADTGRALVVRSDYLKPSSYLVPITPKDDVLLDTIEQLMDGCRKDGQAFRLAEVDGDVLTLIQETWPHRFTAREFSPGANYIYRQQDLAQLSGHSYNAKRNHVRQFERACPGWELAPIDDTNLASCEALEWKWFQGHSQSNDVEQEHRGVLDALAHLKQLPCEAAALMWQGQAVAFTVGGRLNDDTASIHIEKADPEIPGSFQAINCFFAREYCGWAEFINRAEDMDDPGLRRAKQSYHPCRMEKKYILELR